MPGGQGAGCPSRCYSQRPPSSLGTHVDSLWVAGCRGVCGLAWTTPLDESLIVAEPWVTGVPDRVPEKVERQHHNGDGEAREDYQRPVGNEDIRDRAAHHIAPGGRRRGNAYPQKAQGRLNDNGHAELCRNEHQIRRDTLRGDVLQDDPEMRRPKGRGGIDVGEL